MEILSIIPARAGSKGIKNKNITLLGGKPLIAWSIEYSLNCPLINRTIVTTDSEYILGTALRYGAEAPFIRPPELSQDDTQDFPVFLHTIQWLKENENYTPDIIVQLRPTSPIRPPGLIEKTINEILKYPEADCLRTVVESPITPYKSWTKATKYLTPFAKIAGKESYNMPRQKLPKVYWHNGVIDVIRTHTLLQKKSISGENILPFFMDENYLTVDIDKPVDLIIAESILKENQENE
jgi:N-acylneuraminate cytidylyltransferase